MRARQPRRARRLRRWRRWKRQLRSFRPGGLPGEPGQQRQGQPGVPERRRRRPRRPWPGAERGGDRDQPDEPEPDGREPERLPPRATATATARTRTNGGRNWSDTTIPMSFTYGTDRGARRASTGRRAATRPSRGTRRATRTSAARCSTAASGVTSNPDQSSAFYVFRSTGNGGASWNFPGRPIDRVQRHRRNRGSARGQGVHDGRRSRRQPVPGPDLRHLDRVRGRRIGLHLGSPLERLRRDVLAARPRQPDSPLCTVTFGAGTPQGTCNENQFSNPFVGPDGTLYVAYRQLQQRRHGQRQPQPGAAREVDRRRAEASQRRSRSATTTTCRTASPTRTPTRDAPACPRRARRPTRSSGPRTTRWAA